MKIRHNKKRNTAFIYEALIVESTVCALKKDTERQNKAANIIKKYFKNGSVLRKALECYRALYDFYFSSSNTVILIFFSTRSVHTPSNLLDFSTAQLSI